MKLAGLGTFIPNKYNEWSTDIIANSGLSNRIAYIWERCVPQKCCPDWVTLTPYIPGIASEGSVYNLLKCYGQMHKDLNIWKEAIRYIQTDKVPLDPQAFWIGCTQMYRKLYLTGKCCDTDSTLECLTQTTVEAIADRSELVGQTLMTDKKLNIPTALKLLKAGMNQPVKPKRKSLDKQNKNGNSYEPHNKNPSNARINRNKDYNDGKRNQKLRKVHHTSFYIKEDKGIMLASGIPMALVPNKRLLYNFKDESTTKLLAAGMEEIYVEGKGILNIKMNDKITIKMRAVFVPSVKMVMIPLQSICHHHIIVSIYGEYIVNPLNDEKFASICIKDKLWWISRNHIQLPNKNHHVNKVRTSKK
ncbi:hypothetical protein KDRO_D06310 [Kluyveromyces lactis]|nr:hypothetical protein KDRO_D06310 [Kluyveromyces lactis]